MKKVLTTISLFTFFLAGCAGMKPADESSLTFDKAVEAPGIKKADIVDVLEQWLAKSDGFTEKYANRERGSIIGTVELKGLSLDGMGIMKGDINYTLQVDAKDEKFRIEFSKITVTLPATSAMAAETRGPTVSELQDYIKPKLLSYADQISAAMTKQKNW